MHKSKLVPFLFAFFLGVVISESTTVFLATKTMTKIQQGDMLAANPFRNNLPQALKNYEEAQHLWPFLQYDTTFISQRNLIKKTNEDLQSLPAVTIFFKDPFTSADITELTQTIQALPGVTQVKYISKEDAFALYKELNKDDPLLLQMAAPDILPASLEVYVTEQSIKNQIENIARSKSFVSQVAKHSDL